mgnify:CR=1 FL=1
MTVVVVCVVVVSKTVEKAVIVGDAWVMVSVSVVVVVARGILVLMQEHPAEIRSDLMAMMADLKGTAGVATATARLAAAPAVTVVVTVASGSVSVTVAVNGLLERLL